MKNNQVVFSVVFILLLVFTVIGLIIGDPEKIDSYGFDEDDEPDSINEELNDLSIGKLMFRYYDDTISSGDAVDISIILEDDDNEIVWRKDLSSVPFNGLITNTDIVDIRVKGDYELTIIHRSGSIRVRVNYGKRSMPLTLCTGCCLLPITTVAGFVIVLNNNKKADKEKKIWEMERYV